MLVQCFLDRQAEGENVKFTSAAMKLLMQYDWPGNVRELENCINRALTLGDRKVIDESDLTPALLGGNFSAKPQSADAAADDEYSTVALEELGRLTIQRVFVKVTRTEAKAGELLGI